MDGVEGEELTQHQRRRRRPLDRAIVRGGALVAALFAAGALLAPSSTRRDDDPTTRRRLREKRATRKSLLLADPRTVVRKGEDEGRHQAPPQDLLMHLYQRAESEGLGKAAALLWLEELKSMEPSVAHYNGGSAVANDVVVDVVSIGSETRFEYMTAQLETWASQTRHFWGFSERQDYDPNCSSNLAGNDGDNLRSYVDACRSNDRGTGSFGIGHGDSSGWFCAQRRPGRSLGWLQAMYGSLDESGSARSPLPDMLLIVDDDTSLDIDKIKSIVLNRGTDDVVVAAGSVFMLGKYGGFTAAHGGFGTAFNRAALRLLTMPIHCTDMEKKRAGGDFMRNACDRLRANRAGEAELYKDGDTVLDVFYKLASRPLFCMHSDWEMGYMITNYLGTAMEQMEPRGVRNFCDDNSVACHYQKPSDMQDFAAAHPQVQ